MSRLLILLSSLIFAVTTKNIASRQLLVHVLFRHGDRNPDTGVYAYPNDPYDKEIFYQPYGFSQLTNEGKRQGYQLGTFLRNRYRDLVGVSFAPNVVYGRSTYWDRSKMALQSVLAGLFPPKYGEVWNPLLNWQPFSFDVDNVNDDPFLFYFPNPEWEANFDAYAQNLTQQGYFEPYQRLFNYISVHSGYNITNFLHIYLLELPLSIQAQLGFVLPKWTDPIFPEIVQDLVYKQAFQTVGTDTLKSLVSGRLLQRIVEDTQSKINGTITPRDRRIFLYSGHGVDISSLLITLGITPPENPSVGSSVLLEVNQRGPVVGIQVNYKVASDNNVRPLSIPGCGAFCPLDTFVSLVEKYFPDSNVV